jgi:hypothetical protein
MLVIDPADVLRNAVADPHLEALKVPLRTGDAYHWSRQVATLHHRIKGGKDLLVGEIAGRAEQHQRIRPACVTVRRAHHSLLHSFAKTIRSATQPSARAGGRCKAPESCNFARR